MATHFEQSRLYSGVTIQTAYDVVRPAPLPDVFAERHGPMPRITEVTDQVGEWGTEVGQTRRIHMSDGGTVLETLTSLDAPRSFGYRLSEIGGPMKLLVSGVSGRWSFAAEDDGTRVTWSWDVDAKSVLAKPVLPVLGLFWNGYAAKALARAEQMVPR
jgi:Polyketide cyclase / dehydrase and lipid transport